jgi:hypothetical protein
MILSRNLIVLLGTTLTITITTLVGCAPGIIEGSDIGSTDGGDNDGLDYVEDDYLPVENEVAEDYDSGSIDEGSDPDHDEDSMDIPVLLIDGLDTDYYNVPRTSPILLTLQSSLFTSNAEAGYILEAGDDSYIATTNNNLDGAKIIGNKFVWTAYNEYPSSILHGLMVGYNINYIIRHNYFNLLRYTSVFKGGIEEPMSWTSGGHSYNIHKNTRALTIKGMAGVRIYNNTFYSSGYSPLYHISLEENTGGDPNHPAQYTLIKNNIFYQVDGFPAIRVRQSSCLTGLECDYNIYYCENCENNEPNFWIEGTTYSWDQWRALGYDIHSVVLDPNFTDTRSFVPAARLDYGIDLGAEHTIGLATTAKWKVGEYPAVARQNGAWQVGAVIYAE